MRAIVCDGSGDESVLGVAEVEVPEMAPTEVRISVRGAGINRADLLQRRGLYPPPPGSSEILGLECAGRVIEIGAEVTGLAPGDRVMALLTGGGYAEETVAPAGCVMRTWDRLSDIEAAGVPEVFITAFLNLFPIGGLEADQTVLIHGGSGGVGTAAIQLAGTSGARVLVTAGSGDRCRRCREIGADEAFNYRDGDFVEAALAATNGHGVHLILDCIGGGYLDKNLRALATGGRLVIIGLQGGARSELDLGFLLQRRLTIAGSTLRARPTGEKAAIIHQFVDRFGRPMENGSIRPVLDGHLPFDQAAEAHRRLASGEVFGKLVLTPS